jgi:hypothetical protein
VFRPQTDAERAQDRRLHANDSEEIEDEARDEPGEDADEDDDDDDLSAYLASLPTRACCSSQRILSTSTTWKTPMIVIITTSW